MRGFKTKGQLLMNMKILNRTAAEFICLFFFLLTFAWTSAASETYDFNPGWMFMQSDRQLTPKEYKEHKSVWAGAKAATSDAVWPFTSLKFDESDFRPVNLPHDWSVEDGFYPDENGEQGYRKRGWGYYRKRFFVPASWKGKHVELQFGGIATHSTIWVNQTLFHHNYSGYNSFTIDISPALMYGRDNVIAVEVNAVVSEGWWYEGAGIYRDVKLIVSNQVHIPTENGVLVNAELKLDGWNVNGYVNLVNDSIFDLSPTLDIDIMDPDGKKVESKRFAPTLPPNQTVNLPYSIKLYTPRLWSPDSPSIYKLKLTLKNDSRVYDEKTVNFGFRSFKFDFTNGFTLNGKAIKLKGVCNHQDHAGVGAAVPASIEEFRIKKLKEMGANAYRCAHNPPSENILDLCDKYGLFVIDENRTFNAGPDWLEYVRAQVRRDRNHPSVLAWSIFNEEPLRGEYRGQEIARALVNVIRAEDPTRPILAAMNGGFFSDDSARNVLDIVGFNYQYAEIDRFHAEYPNIPVILTEGASAFETRGEPATDPEKLICADFDDYHAEWGTTHRKDWETVLNRRFLAGTFVWTGFDYHGEPTPFNNKFPANSSYFGCMDLCGFPKTAFYIRQAQWLDKPVLFAAPHWNSHKDGQEIDVFCATNVEEVTFILNGKTLGTFKVDPVQMLTQKVVYDPGTLLLIGRKEGKEVIRTQIETTGKPVGLKLVPDRTELKNDGRDAVPVTVCAVDASGRIIPDAKVPVEFEISGPGRNIGVGNGDPTCTLSEKADSRPLFNGYAQIIVQSSETGKKEPVVITAKSEGLSPTSCILKPSASTPVPVIEGFVNQEVTVNGWRITQSTSSKPELLSDESGEDAIQHLTAVQPGNELSLKPKDWVLFFAKSSLPANILENGGSLCFRNMTGKAMIYVNGELLHERKVSTTGDVVIRLKAGLESISLNVLMQPDGKGHASLGDIVYITPEKLKKTAGKKNESDASSSKK